jgi:hypothetical protein
MGTTRDLSERFEMAASDSFRYLEQRYGFVRSTLRPSVNIIILRYENASIYVNAMYGPPAYEAEMSFGRRDIDDVPGGYSFEVGDLIQLETCRDWQSKSVSGGIEEQVAWLASMLEGCGQKCLVGDQSVYSEMKERRDRLAAEWRRQEEAAALSRSIDAAWRRKDYKKIVELCADYGGALGALEEGRLRYAQNHV